MPKIKLNKEVQELIHKKYNVLEYIDLVHGINVEYFINILSKYHSYKFTANERIVILHHDTDYYPSLTSVGNATYNFFRLCANFNISLDHLLFVTNHYNIKKEIQTLAKNICNSNNINVIYTSQWFDFPSDEDINQAKPSVNQYNIDSLYICLNNQQRLHRLLTLCMLVEYDLIDHGVITYHFKE